MLQQLHVFLANAWLSVLRATADCISVQRVYSSGRSSGTCLLPSCSTAGDISRTVTMAATWRRQRPNSRAREGAAQHRHLQATRRTSAQLQDADAGACGCIVHLVRVRACRAGRVLSQTVLPIGPSSLRVAHRNKDLGPYRAAHVGVKAAADSQKADALTESNPDVTRVRHGNRQTELKACAQHCRLPSVSRRHMPVVDSQHSPPQ